LIIDHVVNIGFSRAFSADLLRAFEAEKLQGISKTDHRSIAGPGQPELNPQDA
jgi:hypothetical protein